MARKNSTKSSTASAPPPDEPPPREIQTATLTWQGIAIEISYEPNYLGLPRHAHLELRVIGDAVIPVTETGYRSHFLPPGVVESEGGPAQFTERWLNEAVQDPAWRKRVDANRQLDLFD